MFKADLKSKLEEIFGIEKVTYDLPSEEAPEQDTLFVTIQDAPCKIIDKLQFAKVTGVITVFSQNEKLPFGFFIKKIQSAASNLTKDLFFYDIDTNEGTYVNLVARSAKFVFMYKGEFDPEQGEITSIEFPEEE